MLDQIDSAVDESQEEDLPVEETQDEDIDTNEEVEEEESPTPAPAVDYSEIGRQMGAALREALPAPAPATPSQEDIRKQLNLYEPDQETIDQLLEGGESAMKALQRITKGIRQEYSTVLRHVTEREAQRREETLKPVQEYMLRVQQEQAVNTLISEHKDLAPLKDKLPTLFNLAMQSGFKPVDNDPTGQKTRKAFAATIREMGLVPASPGSQPKRGNPSIPSGDSGGSAGGSKTVKKAPSGNAFMDMLDGFDK